MRKRFLRGMTVIDYLRSALGQRLHGRRTYLLFDLELLRSHNCPLDIVQSELKLMLLSARRILCAKILTWSF